MTDRKLPPPFLDAGIVAVMVAVRTADGRQYFVAGRCRDGDATFHFERPVSPVYDTSPFYPSGYRELDRIFAIEGKFYGFDGVSEWQEGAPDPTAMDPVSTLPMTPKLLGEGPAALAAATATDSPDA